MEWLSVGLAAVGMILLVLGYNMKSEAKDFSIRIVVVGIFCFMVALTALTAMRCNELESRIVALEAQLAKQQPASQNMTASPSRKK